MESSTIIEERRRRQKERVKMTNGNAEACVPEKAHAFSDHSFVEIAKLASPFAMFAGFSLLFYLILEPSSFGVVFGAMLMYSVPNAVGKETLVPLAVLGLRAARGSSIANVVIAACAVSSIDFIYATFMLLNFEHARRIPILGKYIIKAQANGHSAFVNPWMRKSAFLAIFLYALIPLQGAGGFASSVVGRLVGLERYRVWLACSTGSLAGCFILGLAADRIISAFEDDIFFGLELFFAIVVIAIVCRVAYQKYLRNANDIGARAKK